MDASHGAGVAIQNALAVAGRLIASALTLLIPVS
jgi:hypothetical protein